MSIITTRAEPITSPVRWRTGFSNSRGLSASVSFSPLPLPPLSFFALAPSFARLKHRHLPRKRLLRRLKTILHRAYALSSETEAFDTECDKLRSIFSRPSYPRSHIESVIPTFSVQDP